MTKSPFPGMDPFLERQWRDVHGSLIIYARDSLNNQLKPPLRARSEERVFVETDEDEIQPRHPDVYVIEHPQPSKIVQGAPSATAMAVSEVQPIVIRFDDEPVTERFLEIVDAQSGERVVTAIEFLSPTNKRRGAGQDLYLAKRREYWSTGANLVDIDLTRGGSRGQIVSARKIPPAHRRATYFASIRRASKANELQFYPIPLSARLPVIDVPLRPGDGDVQLDLQALVDRAWRNGPGDTLDYTSPLDPPLSPAEAEFAEQVLKAAGKR
jgi:hypothetical protein